MVTALRGPRHESDVLVRQVEGRLATLRGSGPGEQPSGSDLARAERIAANLRLLIVETAAASAADRARVRAAVHYFVGLRNAAHRRPSRTLAEDIRVINEILRGLDRTDLVVV